MRARSVQFAVVREDPAIEADVIRRLDVRRALLIASGGCTALSLMVSFPRLDLTLVDRNAAQLDLVRRKLDILPSVDAASRRRQFNIGTADPTGLNACGNFQLPSGLGVDRSLMSNGGFSVDIQGTVEPGFSRVRDAFARNFEDLNESGAAVSVYRHGRKVVDLWAGVADSPASDAWAEDTLVTVFSTTKGATAIAALMLADRGALDLDAPVARYWPEFAAAGKERIPVRMILGHQVGLPVVDAHLTFEDVLAGEPVVRALAAQRPIWEPGSKHGYHGLTYGWLVGEVVRRVTGMSLGRFFASEIARPLGLDFWIGLPEAEERRVAPVVDGPPPTDPATLRLMASLSEPGSLFWRMGTMNGAIPFGESSVAGVYNLRRVHAAEIPAANGITTARSLAKLYAATLAEVDGIRLFGPETLRRALEVTSEGPDALLGVDIRFGLGFGRDGGDVRLLGPGSYGHGGAGGSFGFADPPSGIAFGYVMKQMGSSLVIDPRAERLIDAVRESIR